ncbi:MAG TPA: DegT/DnrJ/EryC1/StrS family aminotransferase [Burkholderiaceae bacterium]
MNVPFLDLGAAYRELQDELEPALLASMRSGWYIGGPSVESFERAFAAYTESAHCVSLANGLDALHLALRAFDIGPGDEVIVPSNTYIATWLAVSQCGAIPVPVEPVEGTSNLDPALIEAAITPRTRVILPVHLYGQPADLDPILAIARKHGLRVLEDGAQVHGARYKGKRIGGHGDIVTWSFYPGKNLGALGDAGGITTNDAKLADRISVLRNYGSRVKYINEEPGYNSRLDPIHAVAMEIKLKHLDSWNARRTVAAAAYNRGLADTGLMLPEVPDWAEPVWHLYTIRTADRDGLQKYLADAGIGTMIHYPRPPHLQQAYANAGFRKGQFPIAERMAEELLSLPIGPQMHAEQIEYVIDRIKAR